MRYAEWGILLGISAAAVVLSKLVPLRLPIVA